MSMMPIGNVGMAGPRAAPGLGQWLASFTAGQQPMLPPASMQGASPQPGGPGGSILMNAVGPAPLPAPVPRYQSASPGAGGIAPGPMQDGQSTPSGATTKPRISKGQLIAGIFSDALAGFTGQQPTFGPMWQRERQLEDQRGHEEARWHRDRQAKREDAMAPRMEQVGDSLGTYDPITKTFEPIYTKPQPFEAYARAQGYQPGTEEYAQAVEDYRLGSWSDPALENRTGFEGYRAQGRSALESERAGYRLRETRERLGVSRENNIRSTGVSRENNIRSTGTSAANNQRSTATSAANNQRSTGQSNINNIRSTTTTQGSASYQGRGGKGGGATARIINPQTGQAMVLRNGQWVPEK